LALSLSHRNGRGKHRESSVELDCFLIPSPTKWERVRVRAVL
jgi:hypothetical protein